MQYRYGDSWERYPIEPGEVWGLPNGSRVAVHDICESLPDWLRADLLFVDPPWSLGNLNCFYTKAGRTDYHRDFERFADILFQRIKEIGPAVAYIEIGNQAVGQWTMRLAGQFRYVQSWSMRYYHKHPTNLLRGSHWGPIDYDFSDLDESQCIVLLTQMEIYRTIADPCMGRGLVGLAAYRARRRFVGTELNKRRLAVLLDRLGKVGAEVRRYA